MTQNRVIPAITELLVPYGDTNDSEIPEISIVVPALNERLTIGEFVDWCHAGLEVSGAKGEIIIVDSSSDNTGEIALLKGARVLRTPKRGLGHAYTDAVPYIRGQYIIMGDCDLTYDFRKLGSFVDAFRGGAEFVMGSRFRGTIEDGAMPPLHRYFGTPLTTMILNVIYGSKYTDIHCGMRGLTKRALLRISLKSTGWEYASEMVLKASRLKLATVEVPVSFFKDRDGRVSHHRRLGFWSPWVAGWLNLKVMLVYSPEFFLVRPGVVIILMGLVLSCLSASGSLKIGIVGFDTHILLLGITAVVFGNSLFQAGVLAQQIHGLRQGASRAVAGFLTYDRSMFAAFTLVVFGLVLAARFIGGYINDDFALSGVSRTAVLGLLFIIVGLQTFAFSLLSELLRWEVERPRADISAQQQEVL